MLSFTKIGPAQADQADGVDQHTKTAADHAKRNPAFLAVIETSVPHLNRRRSVKIFCLVEVHSVLGEIGGAFALVPFIAHDALGGGLNQLKGTACFFDNR